MPDKDRIAELAELAKSASERAYAPYSRFPVGAAVLTNDGRVFTGCNVENASYGLTICAERNAIFHMVSEGAREIDTVVIFTPTPTPSAPCGAGRQVINEFGPTATVLSVCTSSSQNLDMSLDLLLPDAFGPHNLT